MDLRKIKKLIELVEESGISELEVKDGDEAIRIARNRSVLAAAVAASPAAPRSVGGDQSGEVVASPIAGTFYRSPAPGEPPFVSEGQAVVAGDVLCIIESMKMMNQIESERTGTVVEVLLDNGKPIEAGTPLFRIA